MLCDYHIHSIYSDDSSYRVEDIVKDAIALGLNEICLTDHVDYGIKFDHDDPRSKIIRDGIVFANVDYPKYVQEINSLQEKYRNQIVIKMGMEFGMQVHTIVKYQKLFDQYPFDFIILSCHQIDDKEFWTQDFQRGLSQDEYQYRYYKEILEVIKRYKDYSVLGHLDMIKRYDENGDYPFVKTQEIVKEILKIVIEDGKGIEVNTSCHRYGLKDLTPSKDVLKLYKELGGQIITIGSDTHSKEHLGAYIQETKEILKELGFQYYCTYQDMKPQFHKL